MLASVSFSRSTLQSADCCPAGMTWTPVRGGNGGSRSFHTFFFAGGWKLLREFKDSELFLKTDCDLVVEDEVTASSSSCITVTPQYPTFHERLIWCICSCDRGSRPVTFNIGKIIPLTQLRHSILQHIQRTTSLHFFYSMHLKRLLSLKVTKTALIYTAF